PKPIATNSPASASPTPLANTHTAGAVNDSSSDPLKTKDDALTTPARRFAVAKAESPSTQRRHGKLAQATTLNNAAWRMATSPDERYLNGERAVELATEACELTEWKRAADIDTLAAAYAEAGDFEEAIRWQMKAVELSVEQSMKKEAQARLELYREHRPYRVQ
ncbi:MAG: hypothetical protein ACREJM_13945, partial [Candidatus Saccharimonadales bacterium]